MFDFFFACFEPEDSVIPSQAWDRLPGQPYKAEDESTRKAQEGGDEAGDPQRKWEEGII